MQRRERSTDVFVSPGVPLGVPLRVQLGALIVALIAATTGGLVGCGGCGGSHGTTHPPGDADIDGTIIGPGDSGPAIGPLRVDPQNRRYFTAGAGKAIYLTGSHTWASFKDSAHTDPPPPFDYTAFLDFLVAHHHNFMRLWTWEQPHSFDDDPNNLLYFTPFPWQRTMNRGLASDGKPKFDLDQLDPAYFSRLRARVVAARDRGIYVSVMLFDGWDLVNGYNATDGGFPFAAGNNVNNIAATGPEAITLTNRTVTARQEAYVSAVIDAVSDLDNVLFEIANETDADSLPWQLHMLDHVRAVEDTKHRHHPVGLTSTYPTASDDALLASSADWISPVGRLLPSDGTKVILNDTDHSYGWTSLKSDGPAAQRAWAWETLCIGASPLFMDPYLEVWANRNNPSGGRPDSSWNAIRDALGYTRVYAERLDLERTVPSTTLCSTGYCLVEPGRQYLVYQPDPGSFTLTVLAGSYRFEWFNPAKGSVVQSGMMTLPAEQHTFAPPFTGDAVLLLLQ
jgi:hypothetical protein